MRNSVGRRNGGSFVRWCRYVAAFLVIAFIWNVQYIYNLLEPRKTGIDSSSAVNNAAGAEISKNGLHLELLDNYDRQPLTVAKISGDLARDAIKRAKTEKCRQQLIATAYQLENSPETLAPTSLPRSCPLAEPSKYRRYIGCYADDPKDRLLKGGEYVFKESNSIDNCIYQCIRVGQELAGVQYGVECFCGSNKSLQRGTPIDNDYSLCEAYQCPGNASETCGGYKRLVIYETGVGQKAPVNPKHMDVDESIHGRPFVKIVFLLQLNGRSTRQIKRTLKLLYRRKHFYYVHVDSRQPYMYREMLKLEQILPNLKVKRKRFSAIWGGASLLSMMMDSFKDLLDEFRFWPWEYVINLSEADMPLVSVDTIERFLGKHRGSNFLRSHGNATANFIRKQGLDQLFFECDHHMYRLGKRTLPNGIRFDGGSDWFALYRQFIEFAVRGSENPDSNPLASGLRKLFETALLPAESFFHTLALNSQFCTTVADTNMKLTNWRRKQGCKCQYKHIVDWCGCSPNVIRMENWARLEQPAIFKRLDYFARKFDAIIDQTVIHRVEAQIRKEEASMADIVEEAAESDAAPAPISEESDNTTTSASMTSSPEEKPGFDSYWENQYDILDESMEELRSSNFPTWVLLRSLGRLAIKQIFGSTDSRCRIQCGNIDSIQRMHVYHRLDKFQGLLVQFNGTCSSSGSGRRDQSWSLEAYVKKLVNTTKFGDANQLVKALLTLEVGTKFDVKEEIFRNYAGAMSVDGEIAIRHHWDIEKLDELDHENRKVEIVFMDPVGKIRGAYVQRLENPNGFEYTKLPITKNHKLESGTWKVQLRTDGAVVIAETAFPLLPADNEEKEEDKDRIDDLIRRFYHVQQMCRAQVESIDPATRITNHCEKLFRISPAEEVDASSQSTSTMPLCQRTDWSSFSPDPKSEISGFDWKTGTILPR